MTTFVGIDIGRTGGVAFIDKQGCFSYPLPFKKDSRDNDILDCRALWDMLTDVSGESIVFIERTQAMPGQGVSSMFNYGVTTGMIASTVTLWLPPNEEIHWVQPRVWKKALGLVGGKEHKGESIDLAKKLYTASSEFLKRKKDDGIAEALLIAHYGLITTPKKVITNEKE